MPSPKIIGFFILDPVTGAPLTGLTPTFVSYKNETGSDLSHPSFVEVGGGAYYFSPAFVAGHTIFYLVSTGGAPAYLSGILRPEDFNTDNVDTPSSSLATSSAVTALQGDVTILKKVATGKWAIVSSGPDNNRIVFYDVDGTTPLYKFDLKDVTGVPTTTSPFSRTPV